MELDGNYVSESGIKVHLKDNQVVCLLSDLMEPDETLELFYFCVIANETYIFSGMRDFSMVTQFSWLMFVSSPGTNTGLLQVCVCVWRCVVVLQF